MKVAAKPQDDERLVVDYLFAELDEDAYTVGVGLPEGWTIADLPHLEVANDGTFGNAWPVATISTIRLTAHAKTTTGAKALCGLGWGLLLAHPGSQTGIAQTLPLTGPLPARDPDTRAELAAATARVTVRTQPIT
jgi:hypothetical protein